ncbi:MAG TPA: hypothetical protein VI685_16365 [Candidatus Angelobacter sp.]
MINERRKKLASLSFGEKLELLEKLRQRSLMLAEARERLARKKKDDHLESTKDGQSQITHQ